VDRVLLIIRRRRDLCRTPPCGLCCSV